MMFEHEFSEAGPFIDEVSLELELGIVATACYSEFSARSPPLDKPFASI